MSKKISRPQRRHRQPPMDEITSQDKQRISFGLRLYAKNARAAAVTLQDLGEHADAERFEEVAEDIDRRLLPQFADLTAEG